MRVLLISHGESSQAHERVVILSKEGGVEMALAAPRTWRHPLRTLTFSRDNTDVFQAYPLDVAFNGDIYRYFYRGLARVIRKVRPDVLHIEDEPCAWSTAQTLLLRRILCPEARIVGFTWENIFHRSMSKPRRCLERWALQDLDFIICGNEDAQRVLRLKGYRGRTAVFPQWGVSLDQYRRRACDDLRHRLGLHQPVIGYVGRLIEAKGLRILLGAAARLGPGPGTLLLVGQGPMRETLPSLWRDLGSPFPLVIVDAVPHDEIPTYLSAMDLLVLPSQTTPHWKEQFGHVLIEAMACGVPVIGSDSGEIPRVIGQAGRVFPEQSIDELAAHLRELAQDAALRERLGQLGYERCARKYDLRHVTLKNVDVYRQVLESVGRTPIHLAPSRAVCRRQRHSQDKDL